MNLAKELLSHFQMTESSEDASGITWFGTDGVDVHGLAKFLLNAEARFVTITAFELPNGEGFRLEYLWDLDGRLFGFAFKPVDRVMPSIYDICEAVDWIEREIHEEYAIDFIGREYEPLLLRAGQHPGVNLQEVAK
jgi:Ni,Fe-hydrogenase III component G